MTLMEKIALTMLICIAILGIGYFCASLENDKVCIIEYMDGTIEAIDCWYAKPNSPFFGSPNVLEVSVSGGCDQTKALSTIKRWRVEDKEKVNP